MVTIRLLFRIFETSLKFNYIPEDFINVITFFPPGTITSKITYYDGVQSVFLILIHHCKNILNLLEIFKTSECLKCVSSNVNKMLQLVYTTSVCIVSYKQAYSKHKIV